MKKVIAIVLAIMTAITLPAITRVWAAAGDLDVTFGPPNGFVLLPDSEFRDMVIQPADGKIVAVGSATDNAGVFTNLIAARFNTDGTLDSTFGVGGIVLGPASSRGTAVAIQPDGKIVATGATIATGEALIARFQPNGDPDPTFGQNGFVIQPGIPTFEVAIGPGNTIVLVDFAVDFGGEATQGGGTIELLVARLLSDGDLDPSFGEGGIVSTESGLGFDVAVLGDGRILVAGTVGEFALWRYNTNGALDTTFGGGDGIATAAFPGIAFASGLAVQTDGRIVLAGGFEDQNSSPPVPSTGALARFDPAGNPDLSFDGDGKATTTVAGAEVGFSDVALQSDGAIVAAGAAVGLDDRQVLVSRFTPTGSPDSSFGTNGNVITDFPGILSEALGVRIQSDGRVVIAGNVFFSGSDPSGLVARYNGSGAPPPPPQFNICVQKDSLIFKFNSSTGAYEFRDCASGFLLTGTGTMIVAPCKITLKDTEQSASQSGGDSNNSDDGDGELDLLVKVNTCTNVGTVSLVTSSPPQSYGYTDIDITTGSCACP
jgi:uncharacterized delta-60 repeat protein